MKWIETNKTYYIEDDRGVFVGSYKKCPTCNYDRARGGNFCLNCGAKMEVKNDTMHSL